MSALRPPTEAQVRRFEELCLSSPPLGWYAIANRMGESYSWVRGHFDPTYRAELKARNAHYKSQSRARALAEREARMALVPADHPVRHRSRAEALYDPERDGPPVYPTWGAALTGDPPQGRRELLARHAESDRERGARPRVDWSL